MRSALHSLASARALLTPADMTTWTEWGAVLITAAHVAEGCMHLERGTIELAATKAKGTFVKNVEKLYSICL